MPEYPRTFVLLTLAGICAWAAASAQPLHEGLDPSCPGGTGCEDPKAQATPRGFIELLDPAEPFLEEEESGLDETSDWDMAFPSARSEPSVAFLEWGKGWVVDEPRRVLADGCARTPARARGRLARAVAEGDENGLLSIYSWRGKADGQVPEILAQLQALPPDGAWEGTRVGMWTGAGDVREKVPTYWRWGNGVSHYHFTMREDTECWLVEFSEAPAETVEVFPDHSPIPGGDEQGPAERDLFVF